MPCRRLLVTGHVQGVFYRDWLVGQARGLGITGWVRNRADASVEAMVCGAPDRIDAIVTRARQGSPASRVAAVAVEEVADQTFESFEKRPTV